MAKFKLKHKLVIAGPGGGKTTNMVQKVLEALPHLELNRNLAVITYTNSAAEHIKGKLANHIDIKHNIFVGTIHSFLNKFIVIPFASKLESENLPNEKLFVQYDLQEAFNWIVKNDSKVSEKIKSLKDDVGELNKYKSIIKKNIKNGNKNKGYITFDTTPDLAIECLKNKKIAEIIGNRISYLFIDEFQDTDSKIYLSIEKLLQQDRTKIYAVGDPEQYISSFKGSKMQKFENIPFFKFAKKSNVKIELNSNNYRSSKAITNFLNNFNSKKYDTEIFKQVAIYPRKNISVIYIQGDSNFTESINKFKNEIEKNNINIKNCALIAKQKPDVNRIKNVLKNKTKDAEGKSQNSNNSLNIIKDAFLSIQGLNQKEFLEKNKMDILDLRRICLKIRRLLIDGEIVKTIDFINHIEQLGYIVDSRFPVKINEFTASYSNDEYPIVSNIHKIKGLEVDAIYCIAKTEKELLLWLEKDRVTRETSKRAHKVDRDYPRIGYVAFSRARKMLCICCAEKISKSTYDKFIDLKVKTI